MATVIIHNIFKNYNTNLPTFCSNKNTKGAIRINKHTTKFEEMGVMNMLLYIDDGAIILETRKDLEKATKHNIPQMENNWAKHAYRPSKSKIKN